MSITDLMSYPDATTTTPSEQRFAIITPTPSTMFVLGSRSAADIGYSGITGTTVKHVFLQGTGPETATGTQPSTASTATLEAVGEVLIHSTGSALIQFAAGNAVLGSNNNTYVTGGSAVYIAATPKTPKDIGLADFTVAGGPDMARDAYPTDELASTIDTATKTLDIMRETMLGLAIAYATGVLIGKFNDKKDIAEVIAIAADTTGAVVGHFANPSDGDVNVYGGRSVTTSSADSVFTSAINTVAMTAGAVMTMIGAVESTLLGGVAASVSSFMTSIVGLWKLDLVGGKLAVLAARTGTVEVLGHHIDVGKPIGPGLQKDTKVVVVRAAKVVTIQADASTKAAPSGDTASVSVTTKGVTVSGKEHVVAGDESVQLGAGDHMVRLGTSGASLLGGPAEALKGFGAATKAYGKARAAASEMAAATAKAQKAGTIQNNVLKALAMKQYLMEIENVNKALKLSAPTNKLPSVYGLWLKKAKVALTHGLSELAIASSGAIKIDSAGQPITIQCSPTSSISITPEGVTIKGLVNGGN